MSTKIDGLEKELHESKEELASTQVRLAAVEGGNTSAEEELAKMRQSFEAEADKNKEMGE